MNTFQDTTSAVENDLGERSDKFHITIPEWKLHAGSLCAVRSAFSHAVLCYNQFMLLDEKPALIVAFVADLIFASKIENAAGRLNYRVQWVERAEQVAPPDPSAPLRQPAEHLVGPGAVLLDRLTLERPALIIFDLGNSDIPWKRWIPLIKSVPSTRRIPVLCFGSHVDVTTMQAAKSAGADAVLARSRFVNDLPELIEKYAIVPDYEGLERTCQEPLSKLAIKGLQEFNRGEYFEAHESLEDAWNEDSSPGRELYRAILQIAVAYLQIERQNYNGTIKMFLRVRQWIDPLPGECRGVDIDQLRVDAERVRQEVLALGPERIGDFNRRLFRPVQYRWEQ
jgi:CheY-like chemotaxis protein